jgi:phosphoserine phosphatase
MTDAVATLICPAALSCLSDALIARARQALGGNTATEWLDPGIAADLFFEPGQDFDPKTIAQRLQNVLTGQPVDVIVQARASRRKSLFLADMDSTMIGQECIDELADFVGLKDKVSAITERAMRGELEFEPALRARVALLKDLQVSVVDQILKERITYNEGGRILVQTMRKFGGYTALVSGGFTVFTGPVSAHLGFDEHRSNRLQLAGDKLAGVVEDPILGREAKRERLISLRAERKLSADATLAVGDGANDLAMLGEAGLGIAYRAKPAVAEAAHARLDHADLTALLYAQGYRGADFVRN